MIRQEVDQECAKIKNGMSMVRKKNEISMIDRDGRDYEHGIRRVRKRNGTNMMMDRDGEVRSTG